MRPAPDLDNRDLTSDRQFQTMTETRCIYLLEFILIGIYGRLLMSYGHDFLKE
jgi:hypothetical protein